jgi:hypothetical protein
MKVRCWLQVLVACASDAAGMQPAPARAFPACLPPASVPIVVQIGDAPPVAALLEGGVEIPLSVKEAATGRVLWSGGEHSAVQAFAGMDAAFNGSLAAIDLDGDGLHDRLYAGDMAARLWRFDAHHGANADQWLSGGVFADFGNAEGRGFVAAPDISLAAPAGLAPWLDIAVGTAAPGNPAANNRFYVLRDTAVLDAWPAWHSHRWRPLREYDLRRVPATVQDLHQAAAAVDTTTPGWYVELGRGQVLTPSLTVEHRVVLVVAEAMPRAGSCEIMARTGTLDLAQGRPALADADGGWLARLPRPVAVAGRLHLGVVAGAAVAACTLDGERIAACDLDTRPRRLWWRRMDAE